jgi:hypothetical protein
VDIDPFPGGVGNEAEVGFSSEVNVRNSRTLCQLEPPVQNFRVKLLSYFCWKLAPPACTRDIFLQLNYFSKHLNLLRSHPQPINHGAWISQQNWVVNIKT